MTGLSRDRPVEIHSGHSAGAVGVADRPVLPHDDTTAGVEVQLAPFAEQFRRLIRDNGTKVLRLRQRSPNLNAHAERFVRSIKDECLDRMIFVGQRSLRRAVSEYMTHYLQSTTAAMSTRASALAVCLLMLLSMSAMSQGPVASNPMAAASSPALGLTMKQLVRYPHEDIALPEIAPGVAYASCYRIGRCSLLDLYRFRDRPNRLTRLAPEAPSDTNAGNGWNSYQWVLVPITPEENVLPRYRGAGQVRAEYRTVGMPIDNPN